MLFSDKSSPDELPTHNLDSLRREITGHIRDCNSEEAVRDLERLKSVVEHGFEDYHFIDTTVRLFKQQTSHRADLELQVTQLKADNQWATQQLSSAQDTIISLETSAAELESDNKQLRFMVKLSEIKAENSPPAEDSHPQSPPNEEDDYSQLPIPANLATLNSLVLQYASQGRYEVAVPLCKQALSELELISGKDHPEMATLLNILALAYRDQGQYKLAASYLERCLEIREKIFGAHHPSVAATLNNLAILLGKRGRYREAEPLCKRALEIREQTLGERHPDTAKQLNNLGLVCQHQGKYGQVERYYLRALDIYRGLADKDDLNIIKTTNNLASAYLKLGKFEEAETLYKSVITEFQGKLDRLADESSKSIWEVAEDGDSWGCSGRNHVLAGVLPRWIKVVEVYGASILTTLTNLAALYHRRARHESAAFLEALVRAVKIQCEENESVISADDV